jgi:hydrogenase maturation protease
MSRVRILGVGSPSGDDQAGWLTVDALLASGVQDGDGLVIEKLDRPGASLIAHLEGSEWIILVDAMQGKGEPGQIQHFGQKDWPNYRHGLSSHGFGVLDALLLAQALGSLTPRLDLYGIEMGSVDPDGVPGASVQAAARQLARRIADELSRVSAA